MHLGLIDSLTAEHRALDLLRREFLAAVRTRDLERFDAVRTRMARVLLAHLGHEDRALYDGLIARGGQAGALATEFQREMGGIGQTFRDFIGDWPVARIARDWDAFTAEAEAVMALLSRRMTAEEARLYPLAVAHAARPAA